MPPGRHLGSMLAQMVLQILARNCAAITWVLNAHATLQELSLLWVRYHGQCLPLSVHQNLQLPWLRPHIPLRLSQPNWNALMKAALHLH